MKTGILGGTFNPVHTGHLRAAEEVREALSLDRVLWIPSARPPHKDPGGETMASPEDRLQMVARAIADNPAFECTDMEIGRPGPSYTLTTLEELSRSRPDDTLFFLIGSDAFGELASWHCPEQLFRHAHFVVMNRPPEGFGPARASGLIAPIPDDEMARLDTGAGESLRCTSNVEGGRDVFLLNVSSIDVSATDIRQRLRAGKSVRYLLPAPVESYILNRRLYSSRTRRTVP